MKKTKNRKRVQENLNYHEGLSSNQVKIILRELDFHESSLSQFNEWMVGQTCPVVPRWVNGGIKEEGGVYEYDLFRWIGNQQRGTPLIFD